MAAIVIDSSGKIVARPRSSAAAHLATRRANMAGSRVASSTADLGLAEVEEAGHRFATGVPVEFSHLHNTEKAPKARGDDAYQQRVEPAGYYVLVDDGGGHLSSGWVRGTTSFRSPIVLLWNTGDGGYDDRSWKARLSRHYGGKKGLALSRAIRRAGHDGIVTVRDGATSEVVDLTRIDANRSASSTYRIGTRVQTRDLRSIEYGRSPDRREDIGKIVDLYRPYGRQSRDAGPPYLVQFSNGESTWYDADEVSTARKRDDENRASREAIDANRRVGGGHTYVANKAGLSAEGWQGLSKGRSKRDFDARQLARGTKVELEHTKSRRVAERIAMDHLTEDPRYYEKLARIENHAGSRSVPTLDLWSFPDEGPLGLWGVVAGRGRIRTSPVLFLVDDADAGTTVATTSSGSEYLLGDPHPSMGRSRARALAALRIALTRR